MIVTHHFLVAIARINGRLENFNVLLGKLGTAQASDKLLCLA
jgi:hypothetical protein